MNIALSLDHYPFTWTRELCDAVVFPFETHRKSVSRVYQFIGKGTGSCPIRETIKTCYPRCLSDFECMGYKKCCPNVCGTMSCSDVSPVPSGNNPRDDRTYFNK